MKNINDKKIKELFAQSKINPSKYWQESSRWLLSNLPEKDVTIFKKERFRLKDILFFNLWTMKRKIIFTTVFVLILISVGTVLFFYLRPQIMHSKSIFTDEQKLEILEKVAANNPSSMIAVAGGTKELEASDTYNFIESTNYTIPGKLTSCSPSFLNINGTGLITDTTFVLPDNKSYTKVVAKDDKGQIQFYELDKPVGNNEESYTYRGGKYAVKVTTVNSSISMFMPDNSSDLSPKEKIQQEFGPLADIVDQKVENGITYYILEMPMQSDCFSGTDTSTHNFIMHSWINTQNYQIDRVDVYMNQVDDDHFVATISGTAKTSTKTFDQVSSDFNFDLDVKVKEYYDGDQSKPADVKSILINTGTDLLLVNDNAYQLVNVNSMAVAPLDSYITDRDFYSPDEYGDLVYAYTTKPDPLNINSQNASEVLSFSYTKNSVFFLTISTYAASDSDESIINTAAGANVVSQKITPMAVSINGRTVSAQQYDFVIKGFSCPTTACTDFKETEDNYAFVLFEYNSVKYLIRYDTNTKPDSATFNLTALDPNNSQDLIKINKAFDEMPKD